MSLKYDHPNRVFFPTKTAVQVSIINELPSGFRCWVDSLQCELCLISISRGYDNDLMRRYIVM